MTSLGGEQRPGRLLPTREPSAAGDDLVVSRAQLSRLLTYVDAVIVAVDLDGTISFASPSLDTVAGYDPADAPRAPDGRVRPPRRPRRRRPGCSRRGGRRSGTGPVQPLRVKFASGDWVPMTVDGVAGPEVAPFGAAVVVRSGCSTPSPRPSGSSGAVS